MELFVFGTFWFWALFILANLILFAFTEFKSGGLATMLVVFVLCLLQWYGDIHVFTFIFENPLICVLLGVGYFATGTAWSVVKWWFYVKQQKRLYDEVRHRFCIDKNLDENNPIPDDFKDAFKSYCVYNSRIEICPQVSNHKSDVFLWIGYWPWSMLWTILNDPITRLIKNIYHMISGFLQKISNSIFAGTERDF